MKVKIEIDLTNEHKPKVLIDGNPPNQSLERIRLDIGLLYGIAETIDVDWNFRQASSRI